MRKGRGVYAVMDSMGSVPPTLRLVGLAVGADDVVRVGAISARRLAERDDDYSPKIDLIIKWLEPHRCGVTKSKDENKTTFREHVPRYRRGPVHACCRRETSVGASSNCSYSATSVEFRGQSSGELRLIVNGVNDRNAIKSSDARERRALHLLLSTCPNQIDLTPKSGVIAAQTAKSDSAKERSTYTIKFSNCKQFDRSIVLTIWCLNSAVSVVPVLHAVH